MTEILIGNQRLPTVLGDDGREYVTFVPDRDTDIVELLSDCLGKTRFKKIQIEANNEATDFVVPQVYEGKLSGIFKDLKELNLELTDTANSDLWAKIKINSRGWLEEYHRSNISTEIVKSAEGIQAEFRNADAGLFAKITRTAQGLEEKLTNAQAGLEARIQTTAQGIRQEVTNSVSGLSSSQQQTASALTQEIRDRQGAVSQLTQRVDGIGARVTSAEGNYSTLIQRANGLESRVSNAEGTISSNFTQLKGLIDQRVTRNDVTSIINQSGDAIKLAIQRSGGLNENMSGDEIITAINLSRSGARISGANIFLDGNTTVNGTFTTKIAQAIQIRADQIVAGTLDAAKANIINLNAANIVGLDANFIKAKIELAIIDWMRGKTISAQNDAMKIDLNGGQILYYTDQAAIKRILNGYPTQFVKFATGTVSGKGNAGVTVIGSNRSGTESSNDGGFVGIRAWNGSNIDQIDVVGDHVRLASSAYDSADGWDIITLPNRLEIDAYNTNHRASSRVKVGDVWLWKNSSTYSSLRDTINSIIDNLNLLHNNKTTERGYSYAIPAKV